MVVKLLLLPVVLSVWGAETYGTWVLISALVFNLSIVELGISDAAANKLSYEIARGDAQRALEIFQTSWVLLSTIGIVLIAGVGVASRLVTAFNEAGLGNMAAPELTAVFLGLGAQLALMFQMSLLIAGLRGVGKYSSAVKIFTVSQTLEYGLMLVAVLLGAKLQGAVLAMLLGRVIGFLLLYWSVNRYANVLRYGWKFFRRSAVRDLALPSFGFFCLSLANVVKTQGFVIIVAALLSPYHVALFSAMRTLANSIAQGFQMLSRSLWPEIAVAHAVGDLSTVRGLHRMGCHAAFWLAGSGSLLFFVFGKDIFGLFVGSALVFDEMLWRLFLLTTILGSLWSTSATVQIALDRHKRQAIAYMAFTVLSAVASYYLIPSLGLFAALLALVALEASMVVYVVPDSLKTVGDKAGSFLLFICNPDPRYRLRCMLPSP